MSYRERRGLLLIADLSGYTEYLGHTELAHAQAIIVALLEATIDAAPQAFELAKLEGDAAFFVADEERLAGGAVTGAVRDMFRAFHTRLAAAAAQTTCGCRGCACACKLALKFVAHIGSFGEHSIRGLRELIGADVILVHRLLKNTAARREYALLTLPLLKRLAPELPPVSGGWNGTSTLVTSRSACGTSGRSVPASTVDRGRRRDGAAPVRDPKSTP